MEIAALIDSGMLLIITLASVFELILAVSVITNEKKTRKVLKGIFAKRKKSKARRRKLGKSSLQVVNNA